jgi:hypothetical protein
LATVRILRSSTAGNVPSSLVAGQIAINEADGKLFYRNGSGVVTQLATGGGTELFAYANTASFPGTGSTTALYLSISSGRLFQWNGSVYAEVGPVGGSGSIFTAATVAGFPAIGSSAGVIYLATDTARTYLWQGAYIELGVSGGGGTDTELRALLTPPAPTSVTPTAGNAQVSLAWTAPTVLSVTPITDYTVQFSSNSGSTWTTFTRAASTATSGVVVTSLTNGTAYVFRVSATNGIGTGNYSAASSSVTPAATAPLVMGNRYVGGTLGAYATWSLSGTGTSADPIVGVMRDIGDQSSEWRFTANVSGTLTISARNVPEDGWGQWQVIRITGNATIASGDTSSSNVVTRTASLVAGEQYKIVNYNSGTSFNMRVA